MPTFFVEEPAARWIPPVVWPKHSCDVKIINDMLAMVSQVCADMDPRLWLDLQDDGTRGVGRSTFKTRMVGFVADTSPMTKTYFLSRVGLFLATMAVYGLPANGGRRLREIRNRRAMLRMFLQMRFGLNVQAIDALMENAEPPIEEGTRREFPDVAQPIERPYHAAEQEAALSERRVFRRETPRPVRDVAPESAGATLLTRTIDIADEECADDEGDENAAPSSVAAAPGSRRRPPEVDADATPQRRTRRRVYRVSLEDR